MNANAELTNKLALSEQKACMRARQIAAEASQKKRTKAGISSGPN